MRIYIDGIEQDNAELHITTDAAATPAPVPEAPSIPEPNPIPEPEPEPEPGEPPVVAPEPTEPTPEPEPTIPVTPTGNLLVDQAATMQPGEWRNLADLTTWPGKDEGRTFKALQYLENADGMGWTQPVGYHEGQLMWVLCRSSNNPERLIMMSSNGVFSLIDYPTGFLEDGKKNGGRRPFDRLSVGNGYLLFAPKDSKTEMGYFLRTPLDNPGKWERWGPSFKDSQLDTVGNFSAKWMGMWQRFYAYTPGGKIWSRAWDDDAWTQHSRLAKDTDGNRLSGYAGMLIENPVKQEILIIGGQVFGANPITSDKVYRLTDPLGAPEMLANRRYPDGSPFTLKHGGTKWLVLPDGSYAIHTLQDGQIREWYRTVSGGGTTHFFENFEDLKPWDRYESYAVIDLLPGTEDVFVYVSHIAGLGLYRPKSLDGLPTKRETDPVLVPDGYAPPPPAGSDFAVVAEAVPEGGALEFVSDFSPYDSHQDFWQHGAFSANKDMYGPAGFYDPARNILVYIRDRTPNGSAENNIVVLIYDLTTGKCRRGDVLSIKSDPLAGSPHTYDMQAYDWSRGHAYYESTGEIRRYLVDEDRWEVLPASMPSNMPVDKIAPAGWHEGLDMLVRPQAQKKNQCHLAGWTDQDVLSWRDLGAMGEHDPYQATSHYNRSRGDMLIVGGANGTADSRRVTLIKQDGEIVRKKDIPLDPVTNAPLFGTSLGKNWAVLFHDPMSGNYLYKSGNEFYEYNPDLDEWRFAINFLEPETKHMYPGNYWGWVCIPVPEMGVVAILNYHKDQIYRHKSVFADE